MAVEVYISKEQIAQKVAELGEQITKDYHGETLYVLCVLNGSFIYTADLVREIKTPVEISFLKASSYGEGTESSGEVKINQIGDLDFKDKHVLIVEDIVDTGHTICALKKHIEKEGAKTTKLTSLLFKPARLENEVKIDYLGFEIEDKFVIGYGLDYAEKYRELPYIGIYSE